MLQTHWSVIDVTIILKVHVHVYTGLIQGLCPAKERRRYFVTMCLVGWAQA